MSPSAGPPPPASAPGIALHAEDSRDVVFLWCRCLFPLPATARPRWFWRSQKVKVSSFGFCFLVISENRRDRNLYLLPCWLRVAWEHFCISYREAKLPLRCVTESVSQYSGVAGVNRERYAWLKIIWGVFVMSYVVFCSVFRFIWLYGIKESEPFCFDKGHIDTLGLCSHLVHAVKVIFFFFKKKAYCWFIFPLRLYC